MSAIVDHIPALVWSARPDGRVDFLSQPYLDYIGLSMDQAKDRGWTAAVHPDDVCGLLAAWERLLESGAPGEAEARLRRHDGAYRWFLFRANPLRDTTGAVAKWYGINIDIDDRKRLLDTIPALVWRGTAEGDLDYLNQRAVEFLGHTAEDLSGGRWLEVIHPDHRDRTVQRWMEAVATGASYEDIYQLQRADGQFRWTRSIGTPLRDADGRIVQWFGVIVDVEDRMRAEAELRRSEAFLAQAQRLTLTGNFTADITADDHIWSAELYRIFEFDPAKKVTVRAVRDAIHPQDLAGVDDAFVRSLHGADVDLIVRIITRSGAVKHIHAVAHPIERSTGRRRFVGAVQDVTERVRAEDALNRARAELAHVTRLATLSTLTASITHEVNQPLSGIITNAGTCLRMLAANPPDVDGARETAKRAIRDGNRAADVIAKLRALFTRKAFTLELLDLNAATREVVALAVGELQRSHTVLQADLSDDIPPVSGDRIQLQQVIWNLLRNAIDAMAAIQDRSRQVRISTRRDADAVCLSVRDAGPGFDPQLADQLFDAFYTTKDDGMGIGLSVSRSIIEAHHGRLWAELNDGPGATFSFTIPVNAYHGVADTFV